MSSKPQGIAHCLAPSPPSCAPGTPDQAVEDLAQAVEISNRYAPEHLILHLRQAERHLPLELTNLHGLTILACIITATPGTLWVQQDRASNILLVHVLELVDEEAWIRLIKQRYEKALLEIFGT